MAFGLAERLNERRLVERMAGDFAGELRSRGSVERPERDRRQPIGALELNEEASERRIVLLFFGAHRAVDQITRAGCRAKNILEPFDRIAVRPLQVVEDEDEGRRRSESLCKRLEEAQTLPALELLVRRKVRTLDEQLWQEASDVGQPSRIQFRQSRSQCLVFQPGGDR